MLHSVLIGRHKHKRVERKKLNGYRKNIKHSITSEKTSLAQSHDTYGGLDWLKKVPSNPKGKNHLEKRKEKGNPP